MYANDLSESDWGKTVTPRDGGGRTTSVSIMNKAGVGKMKNGMIAVINNELYSLPMLKRLSKY